MRRLVALVGSTTNKFEQTHSVRVRDFANGCTPRSSILTTLKHLMTSVVFLHTASLLLSQPAMTSRRSGRGPGSRVPFGRPCCRSRRNVTLSRLRGFHCDNGPHERERRFGPKSAPPDCPQEPRRGPQYNTSPQTEARSMPLGDVRWVRNALIRLRWSQP